MQVGKIDHFKNFVKSKKKLITIKKGDHSLSSYKNLKVILNEIDLIKKFIY